MYICELKKNPKHLLIMVYIVYLYHLFGFLRAVKIREKKLNSGDWKAEPLTLNMREHILCLSRIH